MSETVRVGILMGSISDREVMQACADSLDRFGVKYDWRVSSAHRTPKDTHEFASTARERGIRVIICGAGGAAHLAGAVAAATTLPVIGVPVNVSLDGLDALLATVQMPGGVPVATVAVGRAGAKNAALLAVQILALSDPDLARALDEDRLTMADKVRAADAELQRR
ncbi:MAG TPA: 5-(carboxyamino)imidazole ribonucleotide mutase [Deltaproteobacteria bacterium]|nr:5-(carboxyamino)imidazole ribonucleotide mutase [Deltaproteobacteria bacterium]HCP48129.1 5-(carboxyamino)imidazole ribonucleotide mutase [Deltaproteobacteria bacterium]